ncbi:MAG: DinB family protein [Acidimicrobiales bacterium]|nr:DinB family protein [Acidimicrobiales bacterium]
MNATATEQSTVQSAEPAVAATPADVERAELLATLALHRGFLLRTVQGVTDDQARLHPTASELSLASIIKHVSSQETQWVDFILEGTGAIPDFDPTSGPSPAVQAQWEAEFTPTDDETLDVLLARYAEVAERTEAAIWSVADMSDSHPLPVAPWFPPGARWSARTTVLHIIAETAQHAGHADIIRESIDGAKSMG